MYVNENSPDKGYSSLDTTTDASLATEFTMDANKKLQTQLKGASYELMPDLVLDGGAQG